MLPSNGGVPTSTEQKKLPCNCKCSEKMVPWPTRGKKYGGGGEEEEEVATQHRACPPSHANSYALLVSLSPFHVSLSFSYFLQISMNFSRNNNSDIPYIIFEFFYLTISDEPNNLYHHLRSRYPSKLILKESFLSIEFEA